tara:strand:+ start:28401 stop:29252 length:852 start_codon:yes stop_codon:yes gene_type:complete
MIERQFVSQKLKEFQIQEYLASKLLKAGYTHTEIKRTPLGEKVIVYTTRPGLVVGRKGDNIKKLTAELKSRFKLENPQIEIGEVIDAMLDARYVADKVAFHLERFGPKRFKSIGYRVLQEILDAGALGAEVILSGRIPSSRAKSWRFSAGYLKKSGDIAQNQVKKAIIQVHMKIGAIGIKVNIMTPDIVLPDQQLILKAEDKEVSLEDITPKAEGTPETPEVVEEPKEEVAKPKEKKVTKKKEDKPKEKKAPKKVTKIKTKPEAKKEKTKQKIEAKLKKESKK